MTKARAVVAALAATFAFTLTFILPRNPESARQADPGGSSPADASASGSSVRSHASSPHGGATTASAAATQDSAGSPGSAEAGRPTPAWLDRPEFVGRSVAPLQPLGQHWHQADPESPFGRFAGWVDRYANATPETRATLEAEGTQLAAERRSALETLIQSNPKLALDQTLPLEVRESLPASVAAQLETRLSAHGDFSVLAAYPLEGQEPVRPAVRRTLTVDGTEYKAFVYGARLGQPSRRNIPVHGIAVGSVVALSENPVRPLERLETERLKRGGRKPAKDEVCGVSREPVVVRQEETPVDVGGETQWTCGVGHPEWLNLQLQLAASQPGGGSAGDGGTLESPYTEGRKRVIMIRVGFPNYPNPDISSNALAGVHTGVDNFWRNNSYAKTRLAPLGAGSDIVLVNLTNPSTTYDGDAGAFRTAVRAAATAAGIDLSKYDFDVIYSDGGRPAFDFGGLGYVGGPGSWVVGASTSISAHELGHNLGTPHANFWDTGSNTAIGSGDNQEYGDPFDVMGGGSASGSAAGHYVTKFKWRMGWISDTDFPRLTTSGTYRIYAQDLANASGLRGVRITKDASLEYFLEFRQLYTGNEWLMNGIGLRWGNPGNWTSQLIDTTPGSANGKNDAAIAIGRTFSDPAANIHITPIGKGHTFPESIDVVVQIGAAAGNQPPVAIVSASSSSVAPGQPITFTASASDPNGDQLAYYWEFSDSASNVSFDNSPVQTVTFGTAGEYTARCVISDRRGGTAQHTVVVRVGAPSTFRISGHIVDNQNRPVAGALVTAGSRFAFSDSDGSYVVPGLTAGSYAVSAREPIADSYTFLRAYFNSPVTVGPNFTTADFSALAGSVNVYTPLVTKNSASWRYNDTGTDLGTAWRAPAFSDAAWASGTAPLGYPSGSPITTVTSFGPDAANKFPTTYFRKSFNVANPAAYTNLLVELLRDDSAVIYLNGTEVVRDNLPTGTILYSTLASASSGADAYIPTTIPATGLVAGNNVLAVEVHQSSASSSDIVMDVALSGLSVSNVTGLKVVYLAEPPHGSAYVSPANIPLRANVQVGGIAVTRVDYYANGSKVAESAAAPYNTQWTAPPDGTHVLTSVAIVGGTQITSPPVRVTVGPATPPQPTQQLIAANASWKYLAQASAAPASWAATTFNDAAWPAGAAELGFGDGDETTVIPGGPSTTRYTTIYFRRSFAVDDPASVLSLTAGLKRDDGAVIYLNGVEVARDNMPAGTVTYATLASSAGDDGETVYTFSFPTSGLVHGTNTVAVEVHQSAINSSDLSFELSLAAVLRTNRTRGCWVTAPAEGSSFGLPGSITLDAEVVAGNGLGVARVEFFANGQKLGEDTSAPFSLTWTSPLPGAQAITAVATDSAGQPIASAPVNVTVRPPATGLALVSFGDSWRYHDEGSFPGSSWTSRTYDDRTWSSGAAKLGYNTPGLLTTVSFGPDAANKHITTYFRRGFSLPSTAGLSGLLLQLVRDDGAVVYLNGVEVYRDNLQPGPVSWNSTALNTINAPGDQTPIEITLPLSGLLAGTNTVSVEIHQAGPSSSDIAFNLALTALTQTNAPSGLYLSSPAQGARFLSPASIPLAAFLPAAPTGPVEFFANGTKVGEDSTAPYELTWTGASLGSYSITARANVAGSTVTSPAVSVSVNPPAPPILPVAQTLVAAGSAWRYFDSADAPAADWNKPAYDDAAWPVGNARFGHGLDGESTPLTPGRVTHYFRRWFSPGTPVNFDQLKFELIRDDGAVVYLNGQEVFRNNLPDGPVNAGTLAVATIGTPDETLPFTYLLPSAGSGLLSSSNLLAVELHQSAASSSDAGFDLTLTATGTTEPRLYIGSPITGTTLAVGRTVPIEVFASAGALESVALVELFLNGSKIGEGSTAPFRLDYSFTEFGTQTLTARMTTSGGGTVSSTPIQITVAREAASAQFIAATSVWKYLDDGSNLGTSANPIWALPGFNDASWPSAPARFGYGGDGEVTALRQTRADASRIITFYFRKSFNVAPGAVYTNLLFNLLRDDGAVVYLNGREVFRSNMPAGTIGYTTLAPTSVGAADEQTYFPTTVAITNLPTGLNVVAVEVHQQATTSSDLAFDLSLTASGYAEDQTPPSLSVVFQDGQVELSWPATFTGWQLQGSEGPGAPWSPVNIAPLTVNGRFLVPVSPGAPSQFYRLFKP